MFLRTSISMLCVLGDEHLVGMALTFRTVDEVLDIPRQSHLYY